MRRRSFKDKIGLMLYEKPDLNKKILNVKKSFDELNSILKKGKLK